MTINRLNNTRSLVGKASNELYKRLRTLDVRELGISEYNQRYLGDYIDHYHYYAPLYCQLLLTIIGELKKPPSESLLVDYGGGSGLLSFLAREAGFKTVVYTDIYDVSVNDLAITAAALGLSVDHAVAGDVGELVSFLKQQNLHADVICSMDVLEHIYSPEKWMKSISELQPPFSIVFMTSANASNPLVKKKLKRIQRKDELLGNTKKWGWKERDETKPFIEVRKEIIREVAPAINKQDMHILAERTRGLIKEDILACLDEFVRHGTLPPLPRHSSNTCDPNTGNWSENILSPAYLKNLTRECGMKGEIRNATYGYSGKFAFDLVKRILNAIIRFIPSRWLFLSPAYTLIARKTID